MRREAMRREAMRREAMRREAIREGKPFARGSMSEGTPSVDTAWHGGGNGVKGVKGSHP
jgi:hypothetical protein